ncbi:NUDIX hydrolase [Ahrensia marina]|uniref:NUDIX hydrolase n=1 Tax=Ahrensia marina TaxID=1514904 RepID=UPI0006B67393|nr:NUDIX hydrolase [Ahrensia marina]
MANDTAPDFGNGPAPKRYPNTRPKPAASLVLVDTSGDSPRFLMGRRSMKHVFMPGFFVFPGGRFERSDNMSRAALPSEDEALIHAQAAKTPHAGALLSCALRETQEETGIALESDTLNARYLARAITPPGQVRRYDTRFFIALCDSETVSPTRSTDDELSGIAWIGMDEMPEGRIHRITELVLKSSLERLENDPALSKVTKTPTFCFRYGKPVTEYA